MDERVQQKWIGLMVCTCHPLMVIRTQIDMKKDKNTERDNKIEWELN